MTKTQAIVESIHNLKESSIYKTDLVLVNKVAQLLIQCPELLLDKEVQWCLDSLEECCDLYKEAQVDLNDPEVLGDREEYKNAKERLRELKQETNEVARELKGILRDLIYPNVKLGKI